VQSCLAVISLALGLSPDALCLLQRQSLIQYVHEQYVWSEAKRFLSKKESVPPETIAAILVRHLQAEEGDEDKEFKLEFDAATKIQSMYRGRRSYNHRQGLHIAAGLLQRLLRGHIGRQNARKKHHAVTNQAALRIQALERGRRGRHQAISQRERMMDRRKQPATLGEERLLDAESLRSAVKIQSLHRGRQARRETGFRRLKPPQLMLNNLEEEEEEVDHGVPLSARGAGFLEDILKGLAGAEGKDGLANELAETRAVIQIQALLQRGGAPWCLSKGSTGPE